MRRLRSGGCALDRHRHGGSATSRQRPRRRRQGHRRPPAPISRTAPRRTAQRRPPGSTIRRNGIRAPTARAATRRGPPRPDRCRPHKRNRLPARQAESPTQPPARRTPPLQRPSHGGTLCRQRRWSPLQYGEVQASPIARSGRIRDVAAQYLGATAQWLQMAETSQETLLTRPTTNTTSTRAITRAPTAFARRAVRLGLTGELSRRGAGIQSRPLSSFTAA